MESSRDREDAVLGYVRGRKRRISVFRRRTAGTGACGTTSACKYGWLGSSGGKSLSELFAVTG